MGRSLSQSMFELGLILALLLGLAAGASAQTIPDEAKSIAIDATNNVEASDGLGEGAVPKGLWKKLSDWAERIDLEIPARVSKDSESFGYNGHWQRRLEPSYRKGNTTLIDDYKLEARFYPLAGGDFWQNGEDGFRWGVGPAGLVRFMFARQHNGNSLRDRLKIATEKVYNPVRHFPWNSQRALDKMALGDFISLQVQLNIAATGEQINAANPGMGFSVGASYVMSGEFQVHIQRISNSRFRLKLVGIRGREAKGSVRFGHDPGDITFSKISFLDRAIERRFSLKLFQIDWSVPRSNLFLIDYEVDLTDPEVRLAYDGLIARAWTPEAYKILDPTNTREETRQILLTDVRPFDRIFQNERRKKPENRIVDRRFSGNNEILSGGGFSIWLGPRDIAQAHVGSRYTENYITMRDRRDRDREFLMPIYALSNSFRASLGFLSEDVQRSAALLLERVWDKDDNRWEYTMGELSFYLEYRDKKFETKEIRALKNLIKNRLPEGLYETIDWKDWVNEHDRDQARVTSLLVFRPEALSLLHGLGGADLSNYLLKYVKAQPKIKAHPDYQLMKNGGTDYYLRAYSSDVAYRFEHDLNAIYHALVVSLYESAQLKDVRKRVDAFVGIRANPLWQEIGGGFLVHLLETRARQIYGDKGPEELLKSIYYETTWEAKDSDSVHEVIGPCDNRRLYKAVMYIYTLLTNNNLEMRLIDSDDAAPGLPSRSKALRCEQ